MILLKIKSQIFNSIKKILIFKIIIHLIYSLNKIILLFLIIKLKIFMSISPKTKINQDQPQQHLTIIINQEKLFQRNNNKINKHNNHNNNF
jgi:hypothetical protein